MSVATFLKPRDWRVLLACLSLTALYSRTKETTSVGQVASVSGVSLKRASESLNRLADCGVISWKPSKARGASRLSLLDAERDFDRMFRRHRGELATPSEEDVSYPF